MNKIRQLLCRHLFDYADMKRNPEKEDTDERIEWRCWKCGKVFKRQCGLEVLFHGEVLQSPTP